MDAPPEQPKGSPEGDQPEPTPGQERRPSLKVLAILFCVVLGLAVAFALGSRSSSPHDEEGDGGAKPTFVAAVVQQPRPVASTLDLKQHDTLASRQVAQEASANGSLDRVALVNVSVVQAAPAHAPANDHLAQPAGISEDAPAAAEESGDGPLFCVVSSSATHAAQFPRDVCTHLVYSDVYYLADEGKFAPVNDQTFSSLLLLAATTPALRLMVSVAGPSLDDLERAPALLTRFARSTAGWLTARSLAGLAFLEYAASSGRVPEYAPPLQYLREKLSVMGLKLVFGVLIEDWSSPPDAVATKLATIAEHVDYMFLQTHYEKDVQNCRVALPSVYAAVGNRTASVPISVVVSWMEAMSASHKHGTLCFSVSLAALLFSSRKGSSTECDDMNPVSYMQICDQPAWPAVTAGDGQSSLAYMGSQGEHSESHETADFLAVKVSRAVSRLPRACVAVFDVDRDDYEGVCGEPFARLTAVRRAQHDGKFKEKTGRDHSLTEEEKTGEKEREPVKRCMPRGKEDERPLVCVLSERTDSARTVTTSYCTHVVFSLRHFDNADLSVLPDGYLAQLQENGVRVLVAVHERLLQLSSLRESAEATAGQLRSRKLDGLALLYVSRSTRQLPLLARKMKELHDVYQSSGLCVLLSLQMVDYDKPAAHTAIQLSTLYENVDFLVVNTHYSGDYGPCRATPASTFNQPLSTCIPQVPVNLALSWMQNVTGGPSYLCFSVDMRAFAYHMYGPMVVDEACYSEEHLHYEQVCNKDEWAYKQDDYTLTNIGQLSNVLHSFETPATLKSKVVAASRSVRAPCIAAFNYDYEDSSGRCHGTPYARIKSLRQWLDEAVTTGKKGHASIQKGFPESHETGSSTTTSSSFEDYPAERPLVCVISKTVQDEAAVPQGYCTHLVFSGALFNQATQTIIIPRGTWRWRELRRDMALFLGFDDDRLIDYLIKSSSKAGMAFGTLATRVLREQGFNGLALLNVNRTSHSIAELSSALSVIRELFANDLQIVVSLDVIDITAPPTMMAVRLSDIFKFSHLVVFQTHYRHSLGYCEVALPSTFDVPNHSPTVPVETALRWLGRMGAGKQACFSVNLAVIEFLASDDWYLCRKKNLLNYAEVCDTKNWVEVSQPHGALCTLRQKDKLWQAYETEDQLSAKISKAFELSTGACVALFNVDYENYNSACFQKFGRMTSVIQGYLSYQHQRPRPTRRRGLLKLPFNRTMSSSEHKHEGLIRKAEVPRPRLPHGNLMSLRVPFSSRPLLCILSEQWSEVNEVPDTYCSHFVVDVAHLNFKTGMSKTPLNLLKEKFGKRRQYLVKVSKLPLRNLTQYAQGLSASILKLQLHGIAVLNQHVPSPLLLTFNERLLLFRSSLKKDLVLVLGLEIPDFDQKPSDVAARLAPLTRTADIVILQTHFRRLWKFCRTAYPSIVQESNNTCQQSVPMMNAVKWIKLVEENRRLCLSINMATLRFHYVDTPGPDSSCTKSREITNYCDSGPWNESTDVAYSMSAYRHKEGLWDTFEEEELIKAKVKKIEVAYPKSCWAIFNVDYDRDTVPCSVHKESFARLKSLGKVAGYSSEGTESIQPGNDSSKRNRMGAGPYKGKQTGGSLVCVFSGTISEGLLPPEGFCSVAIYTSVIYDEAKRTLVAKDADSLHHFSALAKETSLAGAGVVPNVLAANKTRDFALESAAWLRVKGFNTLALLTNKWPRQDIFTVFKELRSVLKMTEGFGKVSVILGIPPQKKINDLLFLQKEVVDMVIFMNHYQRSNGPCHVMHPSSSSKTTSAMVGLVESADIIKAVSSQLNISTEICVSMNLAVLTFTLGSQKKFRLGSQCLKETSSSYSEVCPSHRGPDILYDSALSCYKQNSTHVQTFENEGTLEMKVEFLKKQLRFPCVAAFHAEYEDTEGVCENRTAFSRIAVIRYSLDAAPVRRENVGKTEVAKRNASSTPALPEPSETLLCVFSEDSMGLSSLPVGLCTHVIYTGLSYLPKSKELMPFDESAFKYFLKLRIDAKLLAAVPSAAIAALQMPREIESFSSAICMWLIKHDLSGLALIATRNANFEQLYAVTKVLRWQFMNSKSRHLQLVFGAPIHVITPALINIADTVNYFVITHHDAIEQSCQIQTVPAKQYGKHDMVETINLVNKMALEVPSAVFCMSLSLAVVNLPSTSGSQQGLVSCSNRTLTTYDKVCSHSQAYTIVEKDFAGVYQRSDNATFYFENEESLLEKVHVAQRIYPLKCIATFYTDYEDVTGICKTRTPFSRLRQISKALGYHETKNEPVPLLETRNTSSFSRSLVCVITDHYPDFDKFPVHYCDYLLYVDPHVRIRRNSFRDFMGDTFQTFLRYRSQPNLLAVLGFLVTDDTWKLQLSDSISYATSLSMWLKEKEFRSLAFVMPVVTDAIAEHLLVFVNLLKKSYPDLKLVLACPVTEKPTALIPFIGTVDMLIFMTHRKSPESPCRITLPSTRSLLQDENNDLAGSSLFIQAFGDKEHRPLMCFSLNFATLKFTVKDNRTEFGAPCEQETWVNYYETCPRSGVYEGFFTGFKTMVQFSEKTVLTYEDEHTVSWKLLSYLQSNPMTCVAAFNLDYEDRRGVCRQPYSRLARLSNALDKVYTEDSYKAIKYKKDTTGKPTTPDMMAKPGDSVARTALASRSPTKVAKPAERGRVGSPDKSGSLVCILSSGPEGFPYDLCTHLIFSDISYDSKKNIIKAVKAAELLMFLRLARQSSAVTAVLANVVESGLLGPANANIIGRFAESLSMWLRERGVQGGALFSSLYGDIKAYDYLILTVWRHFQHTASSRLKLIGGIYFENFKSASSLESLSRNSDLLLLLTHRIIEPETCNVEYPLLFYLTKDDYKFMKSVCDVAQCSVCLSLNLAVATSAVMHSKAQFGDACLQRSFEGYDQTCLALASVDRDHHWDMALRRNASHLQAFEDHTSLTHRVTSFFSVHSTGCVAAFRADLEDLSGKCPDQPKYSRLLTLAKLVGRDTEKFREKDSEGRSGVGWPRIEKSPLICVFRNHYISARFPRNLCTHLIYLSVTYDMYKRKLYEGSDLDSFLQLQGPAAAIVALESLIANTLQAGQHEHIDPFLQILDQFIQERHLDGLAMISTLVSDMNNFVNLAKRLWSHFQSSNLKRKVQLVLGVQLQAINQSTVDSLLSSCDIIIFVNHHIIEPPSCKVSRPSHIPVTKHHRKLMQRVGDSSSKKPVPCISVSLAVHDYRLQSLHGRFMDDCISSKWVGYEHTCPSKIGLIEKDREWGAAYLKEKTTMLVFEDEETIIDKVDTFLEDSPHGCVAAFHVEYEDFIGRCVAREKYSRLQSISKALRRKKTPRQVDHKSDTEELCERRGSKEECHKRLLVCTISMKARNAARLGQLCSHVVFMDATYNQKSRDFSILEQDMGEFLSIKSSKHLAAISPHIITKEIFESEQKQLVFKAVRGLLSRYSRLDGIAMFSTGNTQMELLVRFFSDMKADGRSDDPKRVLLAGLFYRHAAAYLSRLQGICDIIVFMTHIYSPATRCRIAAPTSYMLTTDDILEMKKVMEPAHGMTSTTCISINLVVRVFKGPGAGELNDACEQEEWYNYAQMCPSKDTALHTFSNTSVYWKNGTYMFVFENEGTLTDKVSQFLALHPAGCVVLFEADKDDIDGQCSLWEPAPRVQVVNRLLFYVPMSEKKTHPILIGKGGTKEPTDSALANDQAAKMSKGFSRSPTGGVLICVLKSDLLALKTAQEQCTHLVYMDIEYDPQGQILTRNRTSFEDFIGSKVTMRQLLFVGFPPAVIEYLDTDDKINSFITHGTTLLDDDALDGFALFSYASTKPGRLKQVAEATIKQFREHSRPPHLLMLAVHVGIAADFGTFMDVSDILVLLAHSFEPSSVGCRVEYPFESSFTEKLFEISETLFARAKKKRVLAACISINLAVRQFEIEGGNKELGSKCTSERWENYAKTCPNVKVHTQRGSQNAAAYRLDGSSFLTFEDEETVSIKVLRYLQGNPAPCIAAFRVDAEDSCGACTAREKASRLMAISRLLFPTSECSSTEGMPSISQTHWPPKFATFTTKPSHMLKPKQPSEIFTHALQTSGRRSVSTDHGSTTKVSIMSTQRSSHTRRDRAVLCILAAPVSNSELLVRLCTHIVVTHPDVMLWNAAHSPNRGEQDQFEGTELLLSKGMAEDLLAYEHSFNQLVLRALVSMKMDGYALFSSPNTYPDVMLRTIKDIWQVFGRTKDHKEYTLVVGAQQATLNKVILELGMYSNYIVALPDHLEVPAKCMTKTSNYFKYDDLMLLDELLMSKSSTAMLAISIFLPVVTYDISKRQNRSATFCSKEEWHGYALTCFSYGFKKEVRQLHDPTILRSPTQLMVYEDEMTITDRISTVSITNPNISVAAFYVDAEDLVGSCDNREPASRLASISRLITTRRVKIPPSTPGPRVKRKSMRRPDSLICVYSKEIRFPGLLIEVCDYIIYMSIALKHSARETRVWLDPGYDQLMALDRDEVKGLLLAPDPNFIKSLMHVKNSQLEEYLQLAYDKVKLAKISGLAFFFPDVPLAQAYNLYEKAWKFLSRTGNRPLLLVGLTYVSDLPQLQKFAKKCDFLILVKHDYSIPSKCVVSNPFLKPIEQQDYENLAALVQESQSQTTVGLSLPMAVSEYHLNNGTQTIGASCDYQRWTGYANTCPNPKMRTVYDDNFTRSLKRNGSTLYSFQDERVVAEQVLLFLHRLGRGCIAAFFVEYEDWTGECIARQPVTRLKMMSSQLNRTGGIHFCLHMCRLRTFCEEGS